MAQELEGKKIKSKCTEEPEDWSPRHTKPISREAHPKGQLGVNEAAAFPLLVSTSCRGEHATSVCPQLGHTRHLIALR
jgi:hypothetical protein